MGFPVESFKTPPDEEFICAVCMEVMDSPLMIESCEHILCKECLEGCQKATGKCPLDRIKITAVRPPHRSFVNTLGRLQVKCQFAEAEGDGGCSHVDNLADIRKHEKSCSYKEKDTSQDSQPNKKSSISPPQSPQWHQTGSGDTGTSYVYVKTLLKKKYDECEEQKATIENLTLQLAVLHDNSKVIIPQTELTHLHTRVNFWKSERDKAVNENKPMRGKIVFQVCNISTCKEGQWISPIHYLRGLPWCVVTTIMPTKSIGFHLRCNGKFGMPDWSCSAIATFKIVSSRPSGDYYSKIYHTFNAKETDKGYADFIDWEMLTSRSNGFLMNDSVFLEAEFEADKPRGI